jgi:hypothetical protein
MGAMIKESAKDIVSVHSPHTAELKKNTCKSFQTYPNMCFVLWWAVLNMLKRCEDCQQTEGHYLLNMW